MWNERWLHLDNHLEKLLVRIFFIKISIHNNEKRYRVYWSCSKTAYKTGAVHWPEVLTWLSPFRLPRAKAISKGALIPSKKKEIINIIKRRTFLDAAQNLNPNQIWSYMISATMLPTSELFVTYLLPKSSGFLALFNERERKGTVQLVLGPVYYMVEQ